MTSSLCLVCATESKINSASHQDRFPHSVRRDTADSKKSSIINVDGNDELYVLQWLFNVILVLT
jgi:hypothetical protein